MADDADLPEDAADAADAEAQAEDGADGGAQDGAKPKRFAVPPKLAIAGAGAGAALLAVGLGLGFLIASGGGEGRTAHAEAGHAAAGEAAADDAAEDADAKDPVAAALAAAGELPTVVMIKDPEAPEAPTLELILRGGRVMQVDIGFAASDPELVAAFGPDAGEAGALLRAELKARLDEDMRAALQALPPGAMEGAAGVERLRAVALRHANAALEPAGLAFDEALVTNLFIS